MGYITGVAPLIGVMLALVTSGPILDRGAAYLSKRNHGFFEPEFRLILNIPTFICFAIGAFGWTWSISKEQHYITTAVYLAFLTAGAAFGTIGSISYAMALFPARASDAFGLIMLTKGIYAWSATLYLTSWFVTAGPWHWGLIQGSITLVSRPFPSTILTIVSCRLRSPILDLGQTCSMLDCAISQDPFDFRRRMKIGLGEAF